MENFTSSDLIALTAVISTSAIAIFTIFINRKSVLEAAHKQTISPMRQKWINDLREKIAEYVNELRKVNLDFDENSSLTAKEVNDFYVRVTLIRITIELMLNPKEEDHNKLISLMRESTGNEIDMQKIEINWVKLKDLVDHTKEVLKKEWEEVKKGK